MKEISTHVCKIINKFQVFHLKNKMFLNIPKDHVFFLQKMFFFEEGNF
jgi:hypothetical protein